MHLFIAPKKKGSRRAGSNIIGNEAKRLGKWMGLKDLESLC